jgi:hypothetical protein
MLIFLLLRYKSSHRIINADSVVSGLSLLLLSCKLFSLLRQLVAIRTQYAQHYMVTSVDTIFIPNEILYMFHYIP